MRFTFFLMMLSFGAAAADSECRPQPSARGESTLIETCRMQPPSVSEEEPEVELITDGLTMLVHPYFERAEETRSGVVIRLLFN